MPPRAGTKKTAPKRPTRKAAVSKFVKEKDEDLPDLESFLIDLHSWPDVTDILMSGVFMEAIEEFSNVAEFRKQVKETLSTCYGRRRIPRTPKKLTHKAPPRQLIPQKPTKRLHFDDSNIDSNSTRTQSPVVLTRSAVTLPASASRPILRQASSSALRQASSSATRRLGTPNTPKTLCDINKRLDEAAIRHNELLSEQRKRIARDNEQRKQRVEQNLLMMKQEKERELEEKRQKHERTHQFNESQRTPAKFGSQSHINTPSKYLTPRSREIPQKRQKQDESAIQSELQRVPSVSRIPVAKPRSLLASDSKTPVKSNVMMQSVQIKVDPDKFDDSVIIEEHSKPTENAYEMTPDKVFQPSTENDYNVNDLSSADETDDESNPRKKVPLWAEKENLRREVQALYRSVSKDIVNAHFGMLRPPKLVELFANAKKKYEQVLHNDTTTWDSPKNL